MINKDHNKARAKPKSKATNYFNIEEGSEIIEDIKLLNSKRSPGKSKSSLNQQRKPRNFKGGVDNLNDHFNDSDDDIMKELAPSSKRKEVWKANKNTKDLSIRANYFKPDLNPSTNIDPEIHYNDCVEDDPRPIHRRAQTSDGLIDYSQNDPPEYDSTGS